MNPSASPEIITAGCLNSISLIISVGIVISYIMRKSIHSFPLDIAMVLCSTCTINHILSIVSLFYFSKPLIGFILFLHLMDTVLTALISFTAMISFSRTDMIKMHKKKIVVLYSIIALGIPLMNSIIIGTQWNTTGANLEKTSSFIYLTFTWSIILLNVIFICITICQIKRNSGRFQFNKYGKLVAYGLTPVIAFLPNSIWITIMVIKTYWGWLMYINLIITGLRGTIFTFVYGMNSDIKSSVKELFGGQNKLVGAGNEIPLTNQEEDILNEVDKDEGLLDKDSLRTNDLF